MMLALSLGYHNGNFEFVLMFLVPMFPSRCFFPSVPMLPTSELPTIRELMTTTASSVPIRPVRLRWTADLRK
jgi:hypothetical protein